MVNGATVKNSTISKHFHQFSHMIFICINNMNRKACHWLCFFPTATFLLFPLYLSLTLEFRILYTASRCEISWSSKSLNAESNNLFSSLLQYANEILVIYQWRMWFRSLPNITVRLRELFDKFP